MHDCKDPITQESRINMTLYKYHYFETRRIVLKTDVSFLLIYHHDKIQTLNVAS